MTVRSRNKVFLFLVVLILVFVLVIFCRALGSKSESSAGLQAGTEAESERKTGLTEPATEADSECESETEFESESEFEPALTPAELQTDAESSEPDNDLIDVESQTSSTLPESDDDPIDMESQTASELPESDGGLIEVESAEVITDGELEALLSQIRNSLPIGNGSWSVYVSDLVKGSESSIDNHRMQAASLIKLYIMGAVYENYDALATQYGQDTLDYYLQAMITVSDNDSANALVNYLGSGDTSIGMGIVNDYCLEHGYYETHMGRLLLHSNEFDDNYTSVSDCGHFLQQVYDGNTPENPYADSMYSLLKAQQRRNKIPSQMPEGVSIANKTGELDDVENDAGILYDTANDLILVFMSENLSDVGSAQYTIASLSRQIYDYYCG